MRAILHVFGIHHWRRLPREGVLDWRQCRRCEWMQWKNYLGSHRWYG
jgi:hypothetical protein